LKVQGSMKTSLVPSESYVAKNASWDPASLAYRYSINALIPHMYNTFNPNTNTHDPLYSHYYYFTDNATIDNPASVYNAFLENRNTLVITASSATLGQNVPVPPLEQAGSGDAIAYYLSDMGRLYIFNRSLHDPADQHLVADPADITVAHDGWCLCWGQTSDTVLNFSYLDFYGQRASRSGSVKNMAHLFQNEDEIAHNADDVVVRYDDLLSKAYSPSDSTFTITFNAGYYDLSTLGETILVDVMVNGKLQEGEIPRVARKLESDTAWTPLTEGTRESGAHFAYAREDLAGTDRTKFTVTFFPKAYQDSSGTPGAYCFTITYTAEYLDPTQEIHNSVSIDQLGISREEEGERIDPGSYVDSYGYSFDIRLPKYYEGRNPIPANNAETGAPNAAVFGLYDALTGVELAESRVEEDPVGSGVYKRNIYFTDDPEAFPMPTGEEFPYTPEGEDDIIAFHSDGGLGLNTLYYIQEKQAPAYYDINPQRFYFYATTPSTSSVSPPGYEDLVAQGVAVTVLNNWRVITVQDYFTGEGYPINYATYTYPSGVLNTLTPVHLPTTGSASMLIISATGAILLLLPVCVVMKKLRRRC